MVSDERSKGTNSEHLNYMKVWGLKSKTVN